MNNSRTQSLRTVLLVIAAALTLVIAFLLGRASVTLTSGSTTGALTDPNATAAASESSDDELATTNTAEPEFAPSQTDPKIIELLRSQPRKQADDPRAMGDLNAPVTMITYEDFSCPMCTRYFTQVHPELKQLVEDGKLRIEFHDLVIFPNYGSDIAAKASRAAADQKKFWEFTEAAFAQAGDGSHPNYTEASVLELAQRIGVSDLNRFKEVLNSEQTAASVQAETDTAHQELGIGGTPFFIINDAVVPGALPVDFMVKTVENQLREAKTR